MRLTGEPILSFTPAWIMIAEISAGWAASVTTFIFFSAVVPFWTLDPAWQLGSAAAAILSGALIRYGVRPAVTVMMLIAGACAALIIAHGSLSAVTPVVLARSMISSTLNVAVATVFAMLIPRRAPGLLAQRRSRLEDVVFVIAAASFCVPVVALNAVNAQTASTVTLLGAILHAVIFLIVRRSECIVSALTARLRKGREAARALSGRYDRLPVEAARLFFSSIRENERLRRLATTQGLRLESAKRRVDRLQQSVTAAERSMREQDLERARAVTVTSVMDAQWRAFLDTIPDGLIIVDQKGVIEFANASVRALLGYAPEQLLGKPASQLIPASHASRHPLDLEPSGGARQSTQDHSPDSRGKEIETQVQDASGKPRELSVRVQEFRMQDRTRIGIRLRDVSGLKYLLKELKHARSHTGTNERSRDHFIATMSHEIRTPLHGLMATLDMLRGESLTPEGSRRLAIARTSAKTLFNIANDVLDLSRVEAGAIPLERKPFALGTLLNEALDEAQARADSLKLDLSVHITGRLPQSLIGDPARIKQILRNLLSNALKFTTSGSVTLHAHYDSFKCIIDVKDTGQGVPEDKRESIFEPFVQAEAASSRRFGGAGLGLPISRRLSEAMGGSVVLLRSGPSGSTFRVTMPLEASDEPPIEEQSQRILMTVHGRVLVVEDDPASQYVAQSLLESLECPVTVAPSGAEALNLLRNEEFDLAFMDCEMPGLDGYETTRRARKVLASGARDKHLPIIGMTASAMSEDRQRCFDAGMDDILPKPFSKSALNDMLRKWLAPGAASSTKLEIADRIKGLPVLDTSVFDELWQSLHWRMPAMRRIYDSFLSTTREALQVLGKGMDAEEASDLARRLHSLLGSAGLVGARQVELIAAWVSDAVKERRRQEVQEAVPHLREALRRVQAELDRRFETLEGRRD